MKKTILFVLTLLVIAGTSCKKTGETYDAQAQLAIDEQLIKDFVQSNQLVDMQKHESGVYYQIIEAGDTPPTYTASTKISAKYTGRLLNGTVFGEGTLDAFALGQLIPGWQIGIPKIGKGGKVRLLIPSYYAYGPYQQGAIPSNSVLDFEIELTDIDLE